MGIIALDLGLRGAAAGLFLMIMAVVLVRTRPLTTIKLLGAAMAVGTAAYVIATAPFVPKSTLWWTLPILAANPVLVWLWARATFDDDFVVRRWHGALWLIVVCIGFSVSLGWTAWPTFARAGRSIAVAGGADPGAVGHRANGQDVERRSGCRPAPAAAGDRDVIGAVSSSFSPART